MNNTDSGISSDSLGGTTQAGNDASSSNFAANNQGQDQSNISAGYDNNVDNNTGAPKKQGMMDKIKEKMLPDGPGPTPGFDKDNTAQSAQFANHGADRMKQGNQDLNRE